MLDTAQKIIVTGGAGFIGSHLLDGLLNAAPSARFTVIDAFTYAGSMDNLKGAMGSERVDVIHGDICDTGLVKDALGGADIVLHAAAESHVDRSFSNADAFLRTNIMGTQSIIDGCLVNGVKRLVHISSDEVYGPRHADDPALESDVLLPSNPYSASKAAAENLLNASKLSFDLPVIILRPNNIYGTRQYPEKLIPRLILSLIDGVPIRIHGNGEQRRHFLSVADMQDAVSIIIRDSDDGQVFNIGIENSYSVNEVVALVCRAMAPQYQTEITHVEDRPFNDFDYQTNFDKLQAKGWSPQRDLAEDIGKIIDWVVAHQDSLRQRLAEKPGQ